MKLIGGDSVPVQVLLVEDNPGDIRLTQEAFREANPFVHLHVVMDGVEAMAFLRHEGTHLHALRPDLILLDLNLPKMDGRQVLAQICGSELENDPGRDPDHLHGGGGYCEKLSTASELLPQQTGAVGKVRRPGEEHQ
jgi:hypothetical protein